MSNKWKQLTNAELIHYNMPRGKEWEVLEYFAENNYKVFISLINCRVRPTPYSRKKIVEHYENANLDELPENLKSYILRSKEIFADCVKRGKEIGKINASKAEERRKSFLDDEGKLIQFFELADNIPFTSKDDYFYIAEIFMKSGLSAQSFCLKYQISDVEGFREAMKRVAKNNPEFGAYYEQLTTNMQNAFITLCRKSISEVASGIMGVAEVIENHNDSRNFAKLLELADSLFEDKKIVDKFASAVLKYYYSRLNSYDNSIDPENIKKMLSEKELSFILTSDAMKSLKAGMSINPTHIFKQSIEPYKAKITSVALHKLFDHSSTGFGTKLSCYNSIFRRRTYLKDNPHQMLPDGSIVPVTNDVIDMAECFAIQNNLFRGHGTIIRLNRSIINGKLDYSAETRAYKESLQNQIICDYVECKTLEEYFAQKATSQPKED